MFAHTIHPKMIEYIAIAKGGLVATAITAAGLLGGVLADSIGETTGITIGLGLALAGGLWYFATMFQKLRDDVHHLKSDMADLKNIIGLGNLNRSQQDAIRQQEEETKE